MYASVAAMVNTATLQVLAQMTYGNLQQSKVVPQLLQLVDQSPQGHVSELIQLPPAGVPVSLPVPPNWTHVSQAVVCNMDTANYAVLQKVGGGALRGGSPTTKASALFSAISAAQGHQITLGSDAVTQYDFLYVNGVGLTASISAGDALFLAYPVGQGANTLASLVSLLNSWSNTTGIVAAASGSDLQLTASNYGAQGNLATLAYKFSPTASGTPHYCGAVVPATLDQVLAPNGGISAESFGIGNPAGENQTNPFLWTLRSCDSAGVLANGLATMVWCYLVGY